LLQEKAVNYTNEYNIPIRLAMLKYLPDVNWLWGKAQLIAESGLNPHAQSPVGAIGIAQFMPDTWDVDVRQHFGWDRDEAEPTDPEYAIPAYAWYMRQLWDRWTARRTPGDRLKLAQASYNAGFGNIAAAQRWARAGALSPPNDYDSIIAALPHITGRDNALETITYVQRIERIYNELAVGTQPT
jgi:soluble lytic murein transglycosylase-like protein